ELSILPGAYRGKSLGMQEWNHPSFITSRTMQHLLHILEPNLEDGFMPTMSYDLMRVEQHYATQTQGLDITFDIRSAIYFATHIYTPLKKGYATYKKIEKGNHKGVIYSFVFRDPPVKKTEFYIQEFDTFKTYTPERILRQHCGLPLFHEYERNIAAADIDCI